MRSSRGLVGMACLVGASTTWTAGPSATDTVEFEGHGPVAPAENGVLAHRTDPIIGNDPRGGSE